MTVGYVRRLAFAHVIISGANTRRCLHCNLLSIVCFERRRLSNGVCVCVCVGGGGGGAVLGVRPGNTLWSSVKLPQSER